MSPDHQSVSSSELLFGESIEVLAQEAGWCRIKSLHDNYEGYVHCTDIADSSHSITHWLCTRASPVFEQPDIKSPVSFRLLFGSQISAASGCDDVRFLQLAGGGFVWASHCLTPRAYLQQSMTEVAQSNYLRAPYLWGGRSPDGCDCSGLVQMVAAATGVRLPRDSGDQEVYLIDTIEFNDRQMDDLVYWPGHVGILQSPDALLHATAHSMCCCIEPLQDVIDRAGVPGSVKRLPR